MASVEHKRRTLREGRAFLSDVAASIATSDPGKWPGGEGEIACITDPVVSLWRDWLAAHRLYRETSRRRRKLEAEILGELGNFPRVRITISEEGSFRWTSTAREIDRFLSNPEQDAIRRKARTDLAARHAKWNEVDRRIGYSRARKAELEIGKVEQAYARELSLVTPQSFAGFAAKLHYVLEIEDPTSGLYQQPFPHLRHILTDLVRLIDDRLSIRTLSK